LQAELNAAKPPAQPSTEVAEKTVPMNLLPTMKNKP
jgi:hypothetical protein